ncbi:hypothetical protein [Herbidospora cretacea]|uniref:hypothetical protein n=1 Tax=Herbidospora cretacea TaxID=28444 RepID=UPI0012DE460A|nr:hypothetical protein [Herbidospora cretacea]
MRSLITAGVLALAAGLSATPAAPATAEAKATITCHGGSFNASLNPGVTFKRAVSQITGVGDLGVCSSEQNKKITGGKFRIVASGTGNCPSPLTVGYGRLQIAWNDGTTTEAPQASIRLEATTFSIEAGNMRLSGRTAASPIELGTQCVTSGLTSYTGAVDIFTLGAN